MRKVSSARAQENDAIKLSYGLGWGLFWTPDGEAFFKEGHDAGERNYTVAFPEKKIAIVIMTNSANGEGIYQELLETVLHDTYTPVEWEGFTPYDKLPPRPPLKQHNETCAKNGGARSLLIVPGGNSLRVSNDKSATRVSCALGGGHGESRPANRNSCKRKHCLPGANSMKLDTHWRRPEPCRQATG